jgi:hypothetical protein
VIRTPAPVGGAGILGWAIDGFGHTVGQPFMSSILAVSHTYLWLPLHRYLALAVDPFAKRNPVPER